MRIILIYIPRSGSTSILKYFSKLKPEYECISDPWFEWMNENVHFRKYQYDELILKENVFIKVTYKKLPVSITRIVKDFDKVIFLLRRGVKEQIESMVFATITQSFTDTSKKKYWDGVDSPEMVDDFIFLTETFQTWANVYDKPLFYYEDLFYGDFDLIFKELGIGFDERYFNEYLNKLNRYREGTLEQNNEKRLI